MRKKIWCVLAAIVLLELVFLVPGYAETNFKYGQVYRLRHEFWRNWKDMSNELLDNRNFFRVKSSVWGQADFDTDLSAYVKLTNEFKSYTYYAPSSTKSSGVDDKAFRFEIDEIVFDNLYADVKNAGGLPLDLRIGRQDFLGTYGEGFLIMDGTPQDGSRTFYFNALKACWRIDDKNALDFIYINDTRDEEYLPVINKIKPLQALNTTDEEAFVLYLKSKAIDKLALESYYIFKSEDNKGGSGLQSQKSDLSTIGAYGKYDLSPCVLRGQLAFQFGDYGSYDRTGVGGYVYADHTFKDVTYSPKVSLGMNYLSGDEQGTDDIEGWNPLFSRWPWISELYVLSMVTETGVLGYWTNMMTISSSVSGTINDKTKASLSYHHLWAAEKTAAVADKLTGTDKDRGHLLQARVDYKINKYATSYVLAEYLIPGDFYVDDETGLFLRTEVQLKF